MHVLVDKEKQNVICSNEAGPLDLGGLVGKWIEDGRAVWQPVPDGFELGELVIAASGKVTGDAVKKADRETKASAKTARRERLKNADVGSAPASVRAILQDLVDEIKELGGFR